METIGRFLGVFFGVVFVVAWSFGGIFGAFYWAIAGESWAVLWSLVIPLYGAITVAADLIGW